MSLKKLASDTVLYGMSTIIGRLLNWLLVVIHTRVFIEPKLLADNAQLYIYVVALNIIYTFGMETTFFRFGSKKENQQEAFNQILSFLIILSTILSFIFIAFSTSLIQWMGFPGKERLIIWLAVILAIDTFCALAFVKLRSNNKAKKFVAIKLANIFINIGLNLFYLVLCKNSVEKSLSLGENSWASWFYDPSVGPDYIIWANYVASLITLILLWKEFIGFRFTFELSKLKPILVYAWPLMLMGLAGAINLTADRIMFRGLLPYGFYPAFPEPDQAFSIYSQVYKLSIFMTLVVQAYRYAADPLFFSKLGDKNSPGLIALSTKWFTIACIMIWMGVSLNLEWIQKLIGENYRSAVFIVPILLLANLFIGVFSNVSIWYKLSDKTYYGTWFTIGGMVITVILNIILIPKIGYLGSSITFVISSLLMLLASLYFGQKNYYIPYDIKWITAYLVIAGALIFSTQYLMTGKGPLFLLIKNSILLAFLFGVIYNEIKVRGLNPLKAKF